MAKNLVIVESPAKAKTIEKFLGEEFKVESCYGHVRDLAKKELSVNVEEGFEPTYSIPEDKQKVVNSLKKLAKKAEYVWLATDEDREGEAISWHLMEALGLKKDNTKRIVFHEITKSAILKAIENPRDINEQLVDAQQARRVLDRLVGYELSPVLWKKIKPALSAGRVQSVAVRLIVEREIEIKEFIPESYFRVVAVFQVTKDGKVSNFKAEVPEKFESEDKARRFLEECASAEFTVKNLEVKPGKKSPSAPFTTSTLQQEASRKLGFSVARTMMVAQKLYESGKITYMRTDSVNLSDTAISAAKDEITSRYGANYVNTRQYQTKSKGAQEAHEAIRPSYMNQSSVDGEDPNQRLYELIWKRTIASQMSDAELERTVITINVDNSDNDLVAKGEVIKFDGFLKVYLESREDEEDEATQDVLPRVDIGQQLDLESINATQKFSRAAPRYSEASLVKKLEDLGIGRPSTYAPTISTIQKREYVEKDNREGVEREYTVLSLEHGAIKSEMATEMAGREKAKLFPTDIGTIVNDFLVEHFSKVLDYNFTATVEKEFDEIAQGQKNWNSMIEQFYAPFHEDVETTLETSDKVKGERLLGVDPESGKNIYVKIGRYGPMAQIGEAEDEEKPEFASLQKSQSITTITLEEALELFKLPRSVGDYEGHEMTVAIGRYGPYVKHNESFYSLKKEDDPYTITKEEAIQRIEEKKPRELGNLAGHVIATGIGRYGPYVKHDGKYYSLKKTDNIATITFERAVELIDEKKEAEQKKVIKEFADNKDVQILNGRYGPYIKIGKKNHKIPKDTQPEELSLEDCLKIAGESKKDGDKK